MDKKPNSKNRFVNVVLWCLLLGFAALFAFSGIKLLGINRVYQTGTDTYEAIAESAVVQLTEQEQLPVSAPESSEIPVSESVDVTAYDNAKLPEDELKTSATVLVDFEKLRQINPDVEAWITNGAEINYPVVHGKDNEYYLNHLFDGTENENGSIFSDVHNLPGFVEHNNIV